jgi:hypothetical protein
MSSKDSEYFFVRYYKHENDSNRLLQSESVTSIMTLVNLFFINKKRALSNRNIILNCFINKPCARSLSSKRCKNSTHIISLSYVCETNFYAFSTIKFCLVARL